MRRRLLITLVVLLAIVLFAPTIVLRTPLRGQLLTQLVPPEVGTLTVKQLTVGWLTPISAEGIELVDTAGNRLLVVDRLTIDRTIVSLLQNRRDLGTIRLENPTVRVLVRSDGSTLEDAIQVAVEALGLDDEEPSAEGRPVYRLEVVGGKIYSRQAATGETWLANGVTATVDHSATAALQIEAAGVMQLVPAEGAATVALPASDVGRFELQWSSGETALDAGAKGLTLRLLGNQLPLAALEPWLQRFDRALRLTGELTGEVNASHPSGGIESLTGSASGKISLTHFQLLTNSLQGGTLQLGTTNLAWKAKANNGRLTIENLSAGSDIAMFDLRGTVPEGALQQLIDGKATSLAVAIGSDLEVEGRLNLARLAQQLPQLMQIRQGTTITEGQVQFTASSEPNANGRRLVASLHTTSLHGMSRGRPIVWDVPLAINLVATQDGSRVQRGAFPSDQARVGSLQWDKSLQWAEWRLDQLRCESEFLKFTSSGDARQMQADGQVDLDRLTQRLGQFVDLADWRLTGTGTLEAHYATQQGERFTAEGSGHFREIVVAYRGDVLVQEPSLDWQGIVAGDSQRDSFLPRQLQSGQLTLNAKSDELTLRLTQPTPIGASWKATTWPLRLTTAGGLNAWARRLRPWLDLSDWRLAGKLDLTGEGQIRLDPPAMQLTSSKLTVDALQAESKDWIVREPRIEWTGDASWNSSTGTLTSAQGQFLSSTATASLHDWFWTSDPRQARQVGGWAVVRVDLARLAQMRRAGNPASNATPLLPMGEVTGNIRLSAEQQQVVAAIDLKGKNLRFEKDQPGLPGQPMRRQTIWKEPKLRIAGSVGYSLADDRLQLEGLRIESNSLTLAATGTIEKLATVGSVYLTGTMDYDLASFMPLVTQYAGEGLAMTGRGPGRFKLRGSLSTGNMALTSTTASTTGAAASAANSWDAWQAQLLVPWQSANLYGLPIGQGQISGELKQGRLVVDPLDFDVSGGRLTATPSIRLDPSPGEVILAPGPLLTNVRIKQEISEQMLKYIAPVLADHTRSEGLFSMNLSEARIPIGAPATAQVSGQLVVQSATISPGPMVAEWIRGARQVEALALGRTASPRPPGQPAGQVVLRNQTVSFQLANGRVYHQGLEFEVEGVIVRSRGSVGLDQTLSLVLEIPIQDRWIAGRPLLAGMRGKAIELPVTGTFAKQRFDTSAALKQAAEMFLGGDAVRGAIGNEINRALGKWLGGGK